MLCCVVLCCVVGVSTQVALNQLIKQAKPDRLLIEPTGLGHPQQIVKTLQQAIYHDVLDYKNTLTLLDPRHSLNQRYVEHDIYNQQLAIVDLFVSSFALQKL